MDNIARKLEEAIENGQYLTIKYHGGSQPGTVREIAPIKITGNKVRAKCKTSRAVKTFVVDKIELCTDANGASYIKSENPIRHYESIEQAYLENLTKLQELGWTVNHYKGNDFETVSLHRRFKNGKVRKGYDVCLSYSPFGVELQVDESDTLKEVLYKKTRTFSVESKGKVSRSFSILDNAVAVFLDEAAIKAPNGGDGA